MLSNNLKLKVCGMRLANNIAEVADFQPDYLGFIFYQKSPRYINEVSAELIKYVPATIKTVGVFVNEEMEKVKDLVQKHQLKAIQLHGNETVIYCNELKAFYPDLEIIKAFGIDENFDFEMLTPYLYAVDYFLFDTKTAAHGGSGKTFNWRVLNKYSLKKPYFLSGGIDLEHAETIKQISDERLYALDINSKFEIEPGLKNAGKIEEFIKKMEK
jgi:phosphoribosylanthranilate isomerase